MTWTKSANIRKALMQKAAVARLPLAGTFELTPRCNLSCPMCYVRMTEEEVSRTAAGRELNAHEWIRIAEEARAAGMTFLLLTGGEPLLRADFPMIYEALCGMGLSISINTNGTFFTDTIRALFRRLPPAQVNVTLYGLGREDYKRQCGSEKAYDRVIDSLQWLKEMGILTHLNITMNQGNLPMWEAFEAFARERDLELRMTAYCFSPVRREDAREFNRLPAETAGELVVKDILYREGEEALLQKRNDLDETASPCRLQVDEGNPMACLAGKSQFWIRWDGRMVPCGMLDHPYVDLMREEFGKAWNDLAESTDAIRLCPECRECPDRKSCMNCAAVTYTESGAFDGKPEYMCRFNRAYREALERYTAQDNKEYN